MKKALIIGVSGQDGILLARYLVGLGYSVFGTSRDPLFFSTTARFRALPSAVDLQKCDFSREFPIHTTIDKVRPAEIYNLSGMSSVAQSFKNPALTFQSIVLPTLQILEAMRGTTPTVRFFNASSSECYGGVLNKFAASEETAFSPRSPYAVAKSDAHWQVRVYRDAYSLYACSGILGNHESPFRADHFVTKKIIRAAVEIKRGQRDFLELGNISISRDWGWAEDYVKCMHAMLNANSASDYVIATGRNHTLIEFLQLTFSHLGLNWEDHVRVNQAEIRPLDVVQTSLDPSKVRRELGWSSQTSFEELVEKLIEFEVSGDAIF